MAVRRSGISHRTVRRPQDLEQTGTGDRLIVAAGNRGGPGKALHAWALAQSGKQVLP